MESPIRVLLFVKDGKWHGRCLDYAEDAQGDTQAEVWSELAKAFTGGLPAAVPIDDELGKRWGAAVLPGEHEGFSFRVETW